MTGGATTCAASMCSTSASSSSSSSGAAAANNNTRNSTINRSDCWLSMVKELRKPPPSSSSVADSTQQKKKKEEGKQGTASSGGSSSSEVIKILREKLASAERRLYQAEQELQEVRAQQQQPGQNPAYLNNNDNGFVPRERLLDVIEAVLHHVEPKEGQPEAADALAHLQKELDVLIALRAAAPRTLQPRWTLLTNDETPPSLTTMTDRPKPQARSGRNGGARIPLVLSRATYAANDPSEDRSTVVVGDDDDVNGNFVFAGVWDGHGGTMAADFAQSHVFPNFQKAVDEGNAIPEAFKIAYEQTDTGFLSYAREIQTENPKALFCGTCAVACFVDTRTGQIACGNLGDSRAVMGSYEKDLKTGKKRLRIVPLSEDHTASRVAEQERIRLQHPNDPDVVADICVDDEEDDGPPDWRVKRTCAFTRSIGGELLFIDVPCCIEFCKPSGVEYVGTAYSFPKTVILLPLATQSPIHFPSFLFTPRLTNERHGGCHSL